ncbi:hypothetical protein TNCV_19901 [Trichonephila clavipes]|nr:hypothetical protein TNCV_19901 [Trichonephila clavipes]
MARRRGLLHIEKSSMAVPWTVPGSTLWGFPQCLALKNPLAVTLDPSNLASCIKKLFVLWSDRVESSTPSSGTDKPTSSPGVEQIIASNTIDNESNAQQQEFNDSARFFILKKPSTFSSVSPFLIEKAITSSIVQVKTIRKMRSGDLFLEVTSAKQSAALKTLRKMAHIDITVVPHRSLNYSRGVSSLQRIC